MNFTNKLSITLISLSFIFLIILSSSSFSFHRPWHDGPSCDGCHCEPNQECTYDPDDGCACTYPDEIEEN